MVRGHLPGARFVDLDTDLSGTEGPGRHPLPPVEDFTRTLGRIGIDPGHTVVAYDSSGGAIAARLWWMLDSIGHRSAFVLDGGFGAWAGAGLPLTAELPQASAADYPAPGGWEGVWTATRYARCWVACRCWTPAPRTATGVKTRWPIPGPGTSPPL